MMKRVLERYFRRELPRDHLVCKLAVGSADSRGVVRKSGVEVHVFLCLKQEWKSVLYPLLP